MLPSPNSHTRQSLLREKITIYCYLFGMTLLT